MYARDFRAKARQALKGHWGAAVAVAFVGTLLSGGVSVSSSATEADGYLSFVSHDVWIIAMTILVVSMLLALIIGGVTQFGMCSFFTKLIKGQEARFGDLFSQFHRIWSGICMVFVMGFFVFLWSLLFIIPGIIAGYRYAMVPWLMAEFPDLGVMDAMAESKRLMQGNKWRLFCLEFSFFGWALLVVLTLGIGSLWLAPYTQTSVAAFYMEVTGRSEAQTYREPQAEPWN